MLPTRVNLLPLASTKVELVFLFGSADVVAVLFRDCILYHAQLDLLGLSRLPQVARPSRVDASTAFRWYERIA